MAEGKNHFPVLRTFAIILMEFVMIIWKDCESFKK